MKTISEESIKKILNNLSNDTVNITNKVYYEFSEKQTNKNIIDPDYDVSPAIVIDNLDDEDVYTLAEDIYNAYKTENNTSSSTDGGVSSSASDSSTVVNIGGAIDSIFANLDSAKESLAEDVRKLQEKIKEYSNMFNVDSIGAVFNGILSVIHDGMVDYQDGVSETNFGALMEDSWHGSSTKSFLDYFNNEYASVAKESKRINIMSSTPLDSGETRNSLYGTMIMGTPYLFNNLADPHNRTLINSFIKDGKILSLTPGMPKFNGLTSYSKINNSILNQTENPEEMLNYLLKNGLDRTFSEKDKRYYTFEAKYEDYFAYLETMLNVVWIKLGLAKDGEQFNLFSFFDIKQDAAGGINSSNYNKLKSQYNSSIGFFINAASAISESVDSNTTSIGDSLASDTNSNSETYRRLNYITGMGNGGSFRNLSRNTGIALSSASQVKSLFQETFSNTGAALSGVRNANGVRKVLAAAKLPLAVGKDVINFTNTQDLGAVIQSFATSNGMNVRYPELWADTTYSKNINLDLVFTSPYGDPLSIFKYVYVPFLSLACFALPRQASENGYVSPFFVRADIPGVLTSDLALISSLTWTKGNNSLWTKDGLPRSISCTITLTDLYPYLSMTKRLSFLSANPSYTVFLDNLTGMCTLHDSSSDDPLNEYFKNLIDRVDGVNSNNSHLWNKFNSIKVKEGLDKMNSQRTAVSGRIGRHSIPWLHNSSL